MNKDDYLPLEKYGELGTDVIISLLQNTLHTMVHDNFLYNYLTTLTEREPLISHMGII